MDFSGLNIWELIVASLSTFIVGFLWYGNFLFGKSWQKHAGFNGYIGIEYEGYKLSSEAGIKATKHLLIQSAIGLG